MQLHFPVGTIVADPQTVVTDYFREMILGRRFEEWAYSQENLGHPNRLLFKNWTAAFWIRARGMRWKSMKHFFSDSTDSPMPLGAIRPQAELTTDWPAIRDAVAAVVSVLLREPRVAAANATKLLYQKRPALIPILDSVVCSKLAGSWDLRRVDDVLLAIDAFRAAIMDRTNARSLGQLKRWIGTYDALSLDRSARQRISVVRIYDLIAWKTGRAST